MKHRYNKFGIVYPDDNDPRWITFNGYRMTQNDALNAMPIGTIIHPSGEAFMTNYPLWQELMNERELYFQQQREIAKKLQEEQIKKQIEEQKEKERLRITLLNQRVQTQKEIDHLNSVYQRELRKITRSVDAEYNPIISKLKKQLNTINKQLK